MRDCGPSTPVPMPIRVECECGSRLDAPDSLAGRQAMCGACGRVLKIAAKPAAVANDDEDEEEELEEDFSDDDFEEVSRLPKRVERRRSKVFQQASKSADEVSPRKRKKRRSPENVAPVRKSSSKRKGSIFDVWARGIAFPFRREAMITLGVLSLLFGPIFGGIASAPELFLASMLGPKTIAGMILIGTVILGYFCYFLFQTLRAAAMNDLDLPVATEFDFEEIFIDLWLMVGGAAVVFLPYGVLRTFCRFFEYEAPEEVVWSLLAVLVFLLPMGLASSALHTSVLAANHWTVIQAIFKIPMQYTLTLLVAALLVGSAIATDYLLPVIPYLSGIISWFLNFLVLTSSMYLIGNLYYHNRHRIGWFSELQRQY